MKILYAIKGIVSRIVSPRLDHQRVTRWVATAGTAGTTMLSNNHKTVVAAVILALMFTASVARAQDAATTTVGTIPKQTLTRAGGTLILDVTGNFADSNVADSADLTYTASSASTNRVTVTISPAGMLTISPVTVGDSVITVTAQDGSNTPVSQMFTAEVDLSPMEARGTIMVPHLEVADGAVTVDVSGNFFNADRISTELTYTVSSSRPDVVSVEISNPRSSSGMLTITPVADGTSVITVTARDGPGAPRARQVFSVAVGDRATTPVGTIRDQSLTIADGTQSLTVTRNFADADVPDSADLDYGASSASTNSVTVSISAVGVLTITPVAVGSSVITVMAQEGGATAAIQTFTVTVTIFDLDVDENGAFTVLDGLMIIRYIAGTKGGRDLTAGLSDVDDPDPVATKIRLGIENGVLDVDKNGAVTVLDGLMIIRYIAGTRGGGDLTAGLSDVADPNPVAANIAELILSAPSTY